MNEQSTAIFELEAQPAFRSNSCRRQISELGRLRRAHAVETGLLSSQSKLQRDVRVHPSQIDMLGLFGLEDASTNTDPNSQRNDNKPKPQPAHSCAFAITTSMRSID